MVQNSRVPVFALWDFLVGEGTLGGLVVDGEAQGAMAGSLASKLLQGVPLSQLPIIKTSPNTPMFDYQAMQRFGLSLSKLPAGSRLINPPDSLLKKYQKFIWPVIGLLIFETLLISLLLYNIFRRKRSELKLETSEADIKRLIEASPIPLRVTRLGGEVIYLNRQFREIFGYTIKDIPTMAQWFKKAYPDPEYRRPIEDFWNNGVEKNARIGTPIELREWQVTRKDGSLREIDFSHTQLSELGVTTLFDVTQRNQALRERQGLELKMLQAQKMESLGVLAGATQLGQVVMNLITNASDALDDKPGTISITTGMMDADAAYLAGSYLNDELTPGNYAFVEVSDSGYCMTKETLKKIFDPFFTTKFTGRGLGLAAVLGIIRGHRGAIRIDSEPDQGTSFKILFPCRSEALITSKREIESQIPTDLVEKCGTILIVDDDVTVLDVSRMMLEDHGFRVLIAEDGEEGLAQLHRHAEVGLVLLDLTMPKLNGEQVFRKIRADFPSIRVILSSCYNEQDATTHFVGKGLAGFLHKPYRTEDLLNKVVSVISG